jgi:hypothetical protein
MRAHRLLSGLLLLGCVAASASLSVLSQQAPVPPQTPTIHVQSSLVLVDVIYAGQESLFRPALDHLEKTTWSA